MRWLRRSVPLCLLIVVMSPAPADAWFEWLDRLSGPGRWWGPKIDVRAWCFGPRMPFEEIEKRMQRATLAAVVARDSRSIEAVGVEWNAIVSDLAAMDRGLNVLGDLDPKPKVEAFLERVRLRSIENELRVDELRDVQDAIDLAIARLRRASVAISATGIFVSLCPTEKRKSFAVEVGITGLRAPQNPGYAGNEPIYMTTFTTGLSYRVPFSANRDFIDVGTNVGVYRFYSKGFQDFSGLTIEPFVDLHFPTSYAVSDSRGRRVLSRFNARAGLVFFPAGFKAEKFGSAPGKSDISGGEPSASVTVFFRVKG